MRSLVIIFGIGLFSTNPICAQEQSAKKPTQAQLETWRKQYPAADADKDGVLTLEEAEAYRRVLQSQRRRRRMTPGFRTQYTFATMSDGIEIALAVGYPRGCDRKDTTRAWPAVLEMMGYPDSTVPQSPSEFGGKYVTVRASLRGAGASGGMIQAISPRNGMDGHEIIENWIVKQPWSNGKVALHGHSWGGLTGFMIAATNPPHLTAVAVSGLFDDVYRDIGRIGGVRNTGFPIDWMVNLYKPLGPFDSGEAARLARGLSEEAYQEIVASRPPWELSRGILWQSLTSANYHPAFADASPGTFAAGVRAPIHIMHAYQDEQTGPSGAWLWNLIADDVPKRLVLSNGHHGDVMRFNRQRKSWLDFWTLEDRHQVDSEFTDRDRRVQVHFETPREAGRVNPPLVAADFPLPGTHWTRYYLREDRQLLSEPPASDVEAADSYSVRGGRPDGELDSVHYLLDFDRPTAICGPIAVTLWATCTTVDTDFFVVVADVAPDGVVHLLQRGLLRASHRAIDSMKSIHVQFQGKDLLVRPRHTHLETQPLVPRRPCRFDVEVFPVGHVFREGHRLAIRISPPPAEDVVTRHDDGRAAYKYQSAMPPSTVAILRTAQCPSNVLVPILPDLPPISDQPPAPGSQSGIYAQ